MITIVIKEKTGKTHDAFESALPEPEDRHVGRFRFLLPNVFVLSYFFLKYKALEMVLN